jgi:hypothetical protein
MRALVVAAGLVTGLSGLMGMTGCMGEGRATGPVLHIEVAPSDTPSEDWAKSLSWEQRAFVDKCESAAVEAFKQKRYDDALTETEKALAIAPHHPRVLALAKLSRKGSEVMRARAVSPVGERLPASTQ